MPSGPVVSATNRPLVSGEVSSPTRSYGYPMGETGCDGSTSVGAVGSLTSKIFSPVVFGCGTARYPRSPRTTMAGELYASADWPICSGANVVNVVEYATSDFGAGWPF